MNLTIDAGNSRVKYGIFSNDELAKVIVRDSLKSMDIEELYKEHQIKRSIICASRNLSPENLAYLQSRDTLILEDFRKRQAGRSYSSACGIPFCQ